MKQKGILITAFAEDTKSFLNKNALDWLNITHRHQHKIHELSKKNFPPKNLELAIVDIKGLLGLIDQLYKQHRTALEELRKRDVEVVDLELKIEQLKATEYN